MAGSTSSTGKGGKGKGGNTGPPLKPTDLVPVWMDVATARDLLLALTISLGGSGNGKKKGGKGGNGKKGGTGGTGGMGHPRRR